MNPKHFVLKGNVIIISNDPPFMEWHVRVKIEDQACHSIDDEMSHERKKIFELKLINM